MEKKFISVGKKAKVIKQHSTDLKIGTIVEITESDRKRTQNAGYDYYVKIINGKGSHREGFTDFADYEDLEEIVDEVAPEKAPLLQIPTAPSPAPVSIDPRVEYLNKIEYGKSYFIREIKEQSVEVVKIGNEIYKRESDGTYTPFFGKLDLNYAPLDSSEIPF